MKAFARWLGLGVLVLLWLSTSAAQGTGLLSDWMEIVIPAVTLGAACLVGWGSVRNDVRQHGKDIQALETEKMDKDVFAEFDRRITGQYEQIQKSLDRLDRRSLPPEDTRGTGGSYGA